MRLPAVGSFKKLWGEELTLRSVFASQLHDMRNGEKTNEVHQNLKALACEREEDKDFINSIWSIKIKNYNIFD